MEEQIAKLQTKLKLLDFTAKKTDSTIAIEEHKFNSGADAEEVSKRGEEIE